MLETLKSVAMKILAHIVLSYLVFVSFLNGLYYAGWWHPLTLFLINAHIAIGCYMWGVGSMVSSIIVVSTVVLSVIHYIGILTAFSHF